MRILIILLATLILGSCKNKQNPKTSTNNQKISYEERGLEYVLVTKAELGKNLTGTIQKKKEHLKRYHFVIKKHIL